MTSQQYAVIFEAIITLILAIMTGVVIPFIRSKVEEHQWQTLCRFAEIGVRTAEQEILLNAKKREYVMEYVATKAKSLGLELTEEDISNLVEFTVNSVKYGQTYTRSQS